MSDSLPSQKTPATGSSRWDRFVDALAAGAPNHEKLDKLKGKRWFVRYKITLYTAFAFFLVIGVPEIVTHLNDIPDANELQTLQVRIIRTHLTEPHLFVELPDGTQRGMEWPIPISFKGGFRSHGWTDQEREHLPGCQAVVRGTALKWTVNDRFRVWTLDCPSQSVHVDLANTVFHYQRWLDTRMYAWNVGLVISLCSVGIFFLREKRGNL